VPFQVFVLNVLKNNFSYILECSGMFHVPDFIDGLLIAMSRRKTIAKTFNSRESTDILLVQRKIGKDEENYDT